MLLLLLLLASLLASGAKGMDGHPMYPCAKLKLDQLFLQWLSLPESQTLVSPNAGVIACSQWHERGVHSPGYMSHPPGRACSWL
jgi:hypothetical protein